MSSLVYTDEEGTMKTYVPGLRDNVWFFSPQEKADFVEYVPGCTYNSACAHRFTIVKKDLLGDIAVGSWLLSTGPIVFLLPTTCLNEARDFIECLRGLGNEVVVALYGNRYFDGQKPVQKSPGVIEFRALKDAYFTFYAFSHAQPYTFVAVAGECYDGGFFVQNKFRRLPEVYLRRSLPNPSPNLKPQPEGSPWGRVIRGPISVKN